MQHVFISYKHEDLDFAENVINRVEKAGFSTWADDRLHAGEDWRAMIDVAIKNAFALIVIMTPEAKASEYVTYEWAFAWGVGVKVIPLMLRTTLLHPRLEALQYLNFTSPKVRPWERLIEEIKSAAHAPLAHTISIPLNSPPYVRQAVMALDSPVASDRAGAIDTLKQVNSPEVQSILIESLHHPIDDVRWRAANALGILRAEAAVTTLIELMYDPKKLVRYTAYTSLGYIKDTTALAALVEKLHDPDIDEFESAQIAVAIGELGDATIVPKLLEIFSTDGYQLGMFRYPDLYSQLLTMACSLIKHLGDPYIVLPKLKKIHAEKSRSHSDDRAWEEAMREAIWYLEESFIPEKDPSKLE